MGATGCLRPAGLVLEQPLASCSPLCSGFNEGRSLRRRRVQERRCLQTRVLAPDGPQPQSQDRQPDEWVAASQRLQNLLSGIGYAPVPL